MVAIRTLKKDLKIGRASTFRHFLNCFEIDGKTYGEFSASTLVTEDMARFLAYNQFFIKEFEKDFYRPKTLKDISAKINKEEEEIVDYLNNRNPRFLSQHQLKYISSYRIDWKLGGDYSFLNLLREVSKQELNKV